MNWTTCSGTKPNSSRKRTANHMCDKDHNFVCYSMYVLRPKVEAEFLQLGKEGFLAKVGRIECATCIVHEITVCSLYKPQEKIAAVVNASYTCECIYHRYNIIKWSFLNLLVLHPLQNCLRKIRAKDLVTRYNAYLTFEARTATYCQFVSRPCLTNWSCQLVENKENCWCICTVQPSFFLIKQMHTFVNFCRIHSKEKLLTVRTGRRTCQGNTSY